MCKSATAMSSIHLPPDIVENILLRLPEKSLLRFRCVSKSFCTQIDSSYFINAHLQFSFQTQTRNKLILFRQEPGLASSFHVVDSHTDGHERVDRLVSPVSLPNKSDNIVGSCNGLLLLSSKEQLILWNPFTNRHKILPITQPSLQKFHRRVSSPATDDQHQRYLKYFRLFGLLMCSCYIRGNLFNNDGRLFNEFALGFDEFGLGFDVSSDDYKVIRMHHVTYDEVEAWVYSLKSNSWTRFENVTFDVKARKSCSIFVQCLNRIGNFPTILARFDFSNNKFQLLPIERGRHVYVLDRQVCIGLSHKNGYDNECEVHLLGVADGYDDPMKFWRDLDIIQCHPLGLIYDSIKPLMFYPEAGIMADVEKLGARNIIWYDLKKKTLKEYEIGGVLHNWRNSFTCWESLVPLN